jgi:peptidoglycan/xylan/chitin deacetylase (PgdA/CDA1 family)
VTSPAISLDHRHWIRILAAVARHRSVILGYHGIASYPWREDRFLLQVRPERLRRQLEAMLAAGFRFVTVAELASAADGGTPPPGLATVSFDDGMRNNLTTALPILQSLGIPATVYVPSGWMGGRSPWLADGADNRILEAPEVNELAAAGWEIGAHTVTHADLSMLDYDQCLDEIRRSCDDLAALTGITVQTFAYPFGRYGPTAVQAVRDCGLSAAVTVGTRGWDPFELPRAMVGAADPDPLVLLKMLDLYEPLLSSAPMRRVRQWSKRIRRTSPALSSVDVPPG